MKKYISILILALFIIPSVALASWWNPFTWKVFKKREPVPQVQVINTEKEKTPEEKIVELQKQLDELKNQKITTEPIKEIVNTKEVKKNTPVINSNKSSKQLEEAKKEAELKAKFAEQDALINKQRAEEKARAEALEKQNELEVAKQRVQSQIDAQKSSEEQKLKEDLVKLQNLNIEIKNNCTNPINALKQEALNVKSKYFSDLEYLQSSAGSRGLTTGAVNSQSTKLLNDANTKIQDLNNQVQQKSLECSIKYGI